VPGRLARASFEATAASLTRISNREANRKGRVANQATMGSLNELSPPGFSRRSMSTAGAPARTKSVNASSTKATNAVGSHGFAAFGSRS
jgi:hypothetical protein